MPYRLSAGSSASSEIKRILREEADSALNQVNGAPQPDPETAIHEARKSVKKLRALLRLISTHLPRSVYKRENSHLRDVGRRLYELRDAEAVIEAFDKVSGDLHLTPAVLTAAQERLAENKRQIEDRVDREDVFQEVAEAITECRNRLTKLRLSPDGFPLLEAGLQRTYKQGRKAKAHARKKETPEAFHDWRKRVKDHWYHARLLSEVGSEDWSRRLQRLKELEGLLGDDHNLVVLSEYFKKEDQFSSLNHKLQEVSLQLRAQALQIGKELYKSKWSAVADELRDGHMLWPAKAKKSARKQAAASQSARTKKAALSPAKRKEVQPKPAASAGSNKKTERAIA